MKSDVSRAKAVFGYMQQLDPGAAVARGLPLLVHMLVPLCLDNATNLRSTILADSMRRNSLEYPRVLTHDVYLCAAIGSRRSCGQRLTTAGAHAGPPVAGQCHQPAHSSHRGGHPGPSQAQSLQQRLARMRACKVLQTASSFVRWRHNPGQRLYRVLQQNQTATDT